MKPGTSADGRSGGVDIRGSVNANEITGRDRVIYEAPLPIAKALHQLLRPPDDFTGRTAELAELEAAVGDRGVTISAMQGLGGVGKTSLALRLAAQLLPRYPDAQFYLDLKGVSTQPLSPADVMTHIIRSYHPTAKLPDSEAELGGLYRSVLHNQRAILLLDNARDAQQVEALVPPSGCLLLVTSRQRFTLPGLLAKSLDSLPPADAEALLVRIAPRLAGAKRNNVRRLSKLCGYLPLALRAVGSALSARPDLSPTAYAEKLVEARQRLKLTETDASLLLSYQLLTGDVQKLFRLLAVFPGTFDLRAATAVWRRNRNSSQEVLGQLFGYSLLEYDATSSRYRLHDLVRLFADLRLINHERLASQRWHAKHYIKIAEVVNASHWKGEKATTRALTLFDMEWENIRAASLKVGATEGQAGSPSEKVVPILEFAISFLNRDWAGESITVTVTEEAKSWMVSQMLKNPDLRGRVLDTALGRYVREPLLKVLSQGAITKRPAFIEIYTEGDKLYYRPVDSEQVDGILLYKA